MARLSTGCGIESQFTAMVDPQNVLAITNFSHLKELLTPGIRSMIDGLQFNEEGYLRAMKFRRDKYGNPNKIAGAYGGNRSRCDKNTPNLREAVFQYW